MLIKYVWLQNYSVSTYEQTLTVDNDGVPNTDTGKVSQQFIIQHRNFLQI
jgi:hypothetical protein